MFVVSVEKGCRRSKVNFLRVYTAASTIVMVLSVFCAVRSRLTMEVNRLSQTNFTLIYLHTLPFFLPAFISPLADN